MRFNLVGHLTCAIAVSTLGLAPSASGGDFKQQILNPQPSLGDLFGITVAAVGSDKVMTPR